MVLSIFSRSCFISISSSGSSLIFPINSFIFSLNFSSAIMSLGMCSFLLFVLLLVVLMLTVIGSWSDTVVRNISISHTMSSSINRASIRARSILVRTLSLSFFCFFLSFHVQPNTPSFSFRHTSTTSNLSSQSFCSSLPSIPLLLFPPTLSHFVSITKFKSPIITFTPPSLSIFFSISFIHFRLSLASFGAYSPHIWISSPINPRNLTVAHLPPCLSVSHFILSSSSSISLFFTIIVTPALPSPFTFSTAWMKK